MIPHLTLKTLLAPFPRNVLGHEKPVCERVYGITLDPVPDVPDNARVEILALVARRGGGDTERKFLPVAFLAMPTRQKIIRASVVDWIISGLKCDSTVLELFTIWFWPALKPRQL